MDNSMLKYFKTIGEIQGTIANATTLEEALQGGLKVIVESAGAAGGAIWYADKAGDGALHPYFWIGPVDLTRRSHAPGDGSVGRVFESQRAERLFEFGLLTCHELRLFQLIVLEAQVVLVVLALLGCLQCFCQRLLSLAQCTIILLIGRQSLRIVSNGVQNIQLEILLAEQEVLMLRMDVDEAFTQFLQGGETDGRVVDEGTALACTRQFAPDDAFRSVEIKVVLLEEIAHTILTYVEFSLYHTTLCPSLDRLGVCPLSAQQSDSSENDALTGSRFACDD